MSLRGNYRGVDRRYGENGVFDLDDVARALRRQVHAIFQASSSQATSASAHTFNSVSLGTPSDDRCIVVGTGFRYVSGTPTISSVTIDGAAMTALGAEIDQGGIIGANMFILPWPTGETGAIVVNHSSAVSACGIGVWAVTGGIFQAQAKQLVDDTTLSGGPVASLAVPEKGAVIGYILDIGSAAARTHTWTGITEKFDQTISGFIAHTGASDEFASSNGSLSVNASPNAALANAAAVFAVLR